MSHCNKYYLGQSDRAPSRSLDFPQTLLELRPMIHNDDGAAFLLEHLGHRLLLFLALLKIRRNISNQRDLSVFCCRRTAFTVFNSHALPRLHTDDLASMQINSRVRLAGWLLQTCRSTEDMVTWKVVVHVRLLDARDDTRQGARANDSKTIFPALLQLLQFHYDTLARLGGLIQLLYDGPKLAIDVLVEFVLGQLEIIHFLQTEHHTPEILADEGGEKLWASETVRNTLGFENLIGDFGAGLESKRFGKNEGIITIEENFFDLR